VSQITYRANLSARSFPFLSDNWGRTVIVPQYDNTFSRQLTSQEDVDKDVGIPQIYYCHNVMPHQQGFQSVGYEQIWQAGPAGVIFTDLADFGPGSQYYIGITSTGALYIQLGMGWSYLGLYTPNTLVTTTTVDGIFYIYVGSQGCFTYDAGLNVLVPVVLTALDPTTIDGITSAFGYMIAWGKDKVLWSSAIDPTDFTPSLITGAGGGQVQAAKGDIVAAVPHALGFVLYTRGNIIMNVYSNNIRYPFQAREIVNSGGLNDVHQVTYDANTSSQYAYTTSGLQLISSSNTSTTLPELTDFLAGKKFEDFDEVTGLFSRVDILGHMQTRFTLVADRYLVASYGISRLTHAVIYDLVTKRWGKLKVSHVHCFEYFILAATNTETPRNSIAFLQEDGRAVVVTFEVLAASTPGVICLGKYQFVRQRMLQLNEVNIENIPEGATRRLIDYTALDGKNQVPEDGLLMESAGSFSKYGFRAEGINHSLVLIAPFTLTSLILNFSLGAKR
jgi:hypothetical protein